VQRFCSTGRGQRRIVLAALVFLGATQGCARRDTPGAIRLSLASIENGGYTVRVDGLSRGELAAVRSAAWAELDWQQLLRITVAGNEALPVAGSFAVGADALTFVPRFPFDPGREYVARFDPSRLPTPRGEPVVNQTLGVPSRETGAPTVVTGVSPTGGVWPENLLRFYIHFSAPMSRAPAQGHVRLEDDAGREVTQAFLPLDVDLWDTDRRRFTVFFDPGRVKRGIRPNLELGRALDAGRRYAIVVSRDWRDGSGRSLAQDFRYEFTAAASEERAVDPAGWRIDPPTPGTRDALVVAFPWALDRALLERAIGVARGDGAPVGGEIAVEPGERQWRFTPGDPWAAGPHELVVLTLLEDPAGNRVGRPFEIDMLQAPRPSPEERVTRSFSVTR
jgi:hypothetical protein